MCLGLQCDPVKCYLVLQGAFHLINTKEKIQNTTELYSLSS